MKEVPDKPCWDLASDRAGSQQATEITPRVPRPLAWYLHPAAGQLGVNLKARTWEIDWVPKVDTSHPCYHRKISSKAFPFYADEHKSVVVSREGTVVDG